MIWLSLDWDAVTGDCRYCGYDYEDDKTRGCAWRCRDCDDECSTRPVGTTRKKKEFASAIRSATRILTALSWDETIVRDCHAEITAFLKPGDTVYNVDSHYDNYSDVSKNGGIECGNWVSWAEDNGVDAYNLGDLPDAERRLPEAKKELPSSLFICFSSPYVSTKYDADFKRLIALVGCADFTPLSEKQQRWMRRNSLGMYRATPKLSVLTER